MSSDSKPVFTLLHAYNVQPTVIVSPTAYAPPSMVYLVSPNTDFLTMAKTMHAFEQERNEWMHKYFNAIEGLKYWRAKAQERK